MKKTGNRRWGTMFFISGLVILSFGIQIVLWAPQMSAPAHAQSYIQHVNWYHGQASVAERELKAKEQNARMEQRKESIDTPTHIAASEDNAKNRANRFEWTDALEHSKSQKQ
jgi:hypothetical protein